MSEFKKKCENCGKKIEGLTMRQKNAKYCFECKNLVEEAQKKKSKKV